MKSKAIIILSSILGCAALVGAGFSAWVITQNANASVAGTITVEDVSSQTLTITTSWTTGQGKAIFGGLATHPANAWLKNGTTAESLTNKLKIDVANYTALGTLSISIAASDATKYNAAVTAGYIGALPTFADQTDTVKTNGTCSVDVNFTWGAHFGNTNPETYYNAHQSSDILSGATTYGADAEASLAALYTDLNGITYTITITATVA